MSDQIRLRTGTRPDTAIVSPVTQAMSSRASNETTPATSAGSPIRPRGVRVRNVASISAAYMSVRTGPGATALTRMPLGPSSAANVRVSVLTAALLAA